MFHKVRLNCLQRKVCQVGDLLPDDPEWGVRGRIRAPKAISNAGSSALVAVSGVPPRLAVGLSAALALCLVIRIQAHALCHMLQGQCPPNSDRPSAATGYQSSPPMRGLSTRKPQ